MDETRQERREKKLDKRRNQMRVHGKRFVRLALEQIAKGAKR
jgi:hypothetical protein